MLPIDRTNLTAAQTNQVPNALMRSALNIAAIQTPYDTIDELYNYTSGLVAGGVLQPYPALLSRQAGINCNFDVAQKGTSFTNPGNAIYTLDRWITNIVADSGTLPTSLVHAQQILTPGDLTNSYYGYRLTTNGAGSGFGVNALASLSQRIEFATRYLCGASKKVTVSFYARSSIAGKKLGIGLRQRYGTGGTPSALEFLTGTGNIITLTSTFQRYSVTFTTNTLVGKTFGTNNDEYMDVVLLYLWGTATGSQNFGGSPAAETFVGAGNIDIAQVQVNAGDQALPFQPRSYDEEQRLSLRFNRRISDSGNGYTTFGVGQCISATVAQILIPHGTRMRISSPTLTTGGALALTGPSGTTIPVTAISIITNGRNMDGLLLQVTVASGLTAGSATILSANNDTTAFLNFDAEL